MDLTVVPSALARRRLRSRGGELGERRVQEHLQRDTSLGTL